MISETKAPAPCGRLTSLVPTARPSSGGLASILFTVFIAVLSFGVTIPVFPRLFEHFTGGDVGRAAFLVGLAMTLWSAIQFFAAPVLGSLSDRFGRRPVILLSTFGTATDFAIMVLAPSLGWLFLGRVLNAATAASFSAANAYVADITAPNDRAKNFGFIGAAFSLGFIVGPVVGGALGQIDLRLPFWAGSGLASANTIYGFFVLSESLPLERRRPFEWRQANPLGAFRFLQADKVLLALAGVFLAMQVAHQIYPSIWVLYTGDRFGWSTLFVGLTLAAVGLLGFAVQGLLVSPIVKRIGEHAAMKVGLASWIIGDVVYAVAWSTPTFLLGMPIAGLNGLVTPSLNAIASRRAGPQRQGQLQGANSAMQSFSGLIGPALFAGSFAFSIGPGRGVVPIGAPFFLSSALLLVALLLASRAARDAGRAPKSIS
ncbi:MAG: MFS transporter [Methylocella sp.]